LLFLPYLSRFTHFEDKTGAYNAAPFHGLLLQLRWFLMTPGLLLWRDGASQKNVISTMIKVWWLPD
jgi:hypothetical protein